jgi:signal transduction histidine kinase
MLFIAMFFLVFALFVVAWVFRGGQAFWLGLIIFTFGCCIVGLAGMFPRFGNYSLDDIFGFHFTQPDWLWYLLARFSLYDLIRFRLWSAVGFVVAVGVFSISYTSERRRLPATRMYSMLAYGGLLFFAAFLIWYYDPDHFFKLYKIGASLFTNPQDYNYWLKGQQVVDILALFFIIGIFGYAIWGLNHVFWRSSIFQKKVQALCMGIGILFLSVFFLILFCSGRFSILNAQTMATTLLPLGPHYPVFDYALIRAVPFVAVVVMVTVMIAILRYGFLGKWQVNIPNLDQQINLANQAVRLALHSFKNRFLAVQMAMDMASGQLESINCNEIQGSEPVEKARIQIQWAKDVCIDALNRLDVLHIQAKRLEVNSRWLPLREIWEEAMRRCSARLEEVTVSCRCPDMDIKIWGDREHLSAVLENILQNALDAMAEKQEKGYTPQIWVVMNQEYEWSYIRVTDNGPGISKDNLHKVYRPFFTTKPAKNNWGLGLTYCHRVVKMHGGFINIKSPPGMGTTVEVVLRTVQKI